MIKYIFICIFIIFNCKTCIPEPYRPDTQVYGNPIRPEINVQVLSTESQFDILETKFLNMNNNDDEYKKTILRKLESSIKKFDNDRLHRIKSNMRKMLKSKMDNDKKEYDNVANKMDENYYYNKYEQREAIDKNGLYHQCPYNYIKINDVKGSNDKNEWNEKYSKLKCKNSDESKFYYSDRNYVKKDIVRINHVKYDNTNNQTYYNEIYPVIVGLERIKETTLFDCYNHTRYYTDVYLENWSNSNEPGHLIYYTNATDLEVMLDIKYNEAQMQVMRFVLTSVNKDGYLNKDTENGKFITKRLNGDVYVNVLMIPREYEKNITNEFYSNTLNSTWNYNIEKERSNMLSAFKELIRNNLKHDWRLEYLQSIYVVKGDQIIESEYIHDKRTNQLKYDTSLCKNDTRISSGLRISIYYTLFYIFFITVIFYIFFT